MRMVIPSFVVLLAAAGCGPAAPKWPVGKDTTVVTGPLDKDGYIDYEAALNDRLAQGVTPDNNANVLIWKALGPAPKGNPMPAEFFKRLGIDEPPKDGDYFIALDPFLSDRLKLGPEQLDPIHDQLGPAELRPWTAKDHPQIHEWLQANEKPLNLIVEATRRPEYYNPLVSGTEDGKPHALTQGAFGGVQTTRELVVALTARAMLRLGEGKADDAWQNLLACHRLGQLVARGGTLIESLVGVAIDAIAGGADLAYLEHADLTPQQLRERAKDLRTLPPMPLIADKVDLAERFSHLYGCQVIRRGGSAALNELAGGAAPDARDATADKALAVLDWQTALRTSNAWFDRTAAALRLPDRPDRQKALDEIETDLGGVKNEAGVTVAKLLLGKHPPDKAASKAMGDFFFALLLPAVRKVQEAHDRVEQMHRNLQVAFALAAYRADNGRYPAGLDDLAPKYLPSVPDDLFSGKPLIYRPSEKGYLFYSVGVNGKDDGGHWVDDDPPGDDLKVVVPLPPLKPNR